MNRATQELATRNDGSDYVRRSAVCPEHERKSSDFFGYQRGIEGVLYWTFRCKEKGGHIFNVLPAVGALGPSATYEEYQEWMKKARLDKAMSTGGQ